MWLAFPSSACPSPWETKLDKLVYMFQKLNDSIKSRSQMNQLHSRSSRRTTTPFLDPGLLRLLSGCGRYSCFEAVKSRDSLKWKLQGLQDLQDRQAQVDSHDVIQQQTIHPRLVHYVTLSLSPNTGSRANVSYLSQRPPPRATQAQAPQMT